MKYVSLFLTFVILLGIFGTQIALAEDENKDIIIRINDEQIYTCCSPVIVNDRVMIPARAIAESIGASVDWDETQQKITMIKDDTTAELTIGEANISVNGETIAIDCPPTLIDGVAFAPLRSVSASFGADVEWNAEKRRVEIETPDGLAPSIWSGLRELDELIAGEDVMEFLLSVYDPASGCFFFSISGRDNYPYHADIVNTDYGFASFEMLGIPMWKKGSELLPKEVRDRTVDYVYNLQCEDDGNFYNPTWGKTAPSGRIVLDTNHADVVMNRWNDWNFKYTRAAERMADINLASATDESAKSSGPAHLQSEEAFMNWLKNELPWESNSYVAGDTIINQYKLIEGAGFLDETIEFLNETQNPDTGMWGDNCSDYIDISGAYKISKVYDDSNSQYPNPTKAIESSLKVLEQAGAPEAMSFFWNPLGTVSTIRSIAKKAGGSYQQEVEALVKEYSPKFLDFAVKYMGEYKRPDGGFCYSKNGIISHQEGAPIALPLWGGDTNSTGLAVGIRGSLYSFFGLDAGKPWEPYTDYVIERLTNAPRIEKNPHDFAYTYDDSDLGTVPTDVITGKPTEKTNGVAVATDPHDRNNKVLEYRTKTDALASTTNYMSHPAAFDEFVTEFDMFIASGFGNTSLYNIIMGEQMYTVSTVYAGPDQYNLSVDGVVIGKYLAEEWHKLKFVYKVVDGGAQIDCYVDGRLMKTLERTKAVEEIRRYWIQASHVNVNCTMYIDNWNMYFVNPVYNRLDYFELPE